MTDNDIKLIYEYMEWKLGYLYYPDNLRDKLQPLDSNSAWECMREMEKRGDRLSFEMYSCFEIFDKLDRRIYPSYTFWLMNSENFFPSMSEWLKELKIRKTNEKS